MKICFQGRRLSTLVAIALGMVWRSIREGAADAKGVLCCSILLTCTWQALIESVILDLP